MSKFVALLLAVCCTALVGTGCQSQHRSRPETKASGSGTWQTVWVDPEVVASDANFTLFRSSRIDSVRVDPRATYFPNAPASLTFRIETRNCQATLSLLDATTKRPIAVLLNKSLSAGYYKVAFNGRNFEAGAYVLQAELCGRSVRSRVTVSS